MLRNQNPATCSKAGGGGDFTPPSGTQLHIVRPHLSNNHCNCIFLLKLKPCNWYLFFEDLLLRFCMHFLFPLFPRLILLNLIIMTLCEACMNVSTQLIFLHYTNKVVVTMACFKLCICVAKLVDLLCPYIILRRGASVWLICRRIKMQCNRIWRGERERERRDEICEKEVSKQR